MWITTGRLLNESYKKILTETDPGVLKSMTEFICLVFNKMPDRFVKSLQKMLPLLKSDKQLVRQTAIKMLGQSLEFCLKQDKYKKDRQILLTLLKSSLYDKMNSCRKVALQQIHHLSEHILKVHSLKATVDEKPSIRKEALTGVHRITALLHKQFHLDDDEGWNVACKFVTKLKATRSFLSESYKQFVQENPSLLGEEAE